MKKEVILAIVIGLVMGLFITYGIYLSQRSKEQAQTITTTEELEVEEPTPGPEINGKLTIFNPEDEIITDSQTTQVTGKTNPNAFVIVFVNNDPIILQADETGSFSKEVSLDSMANLIKIHAIDETGEHHTTQRTVIVYTGELAFESDPAEDEEVLQDEAGDAGNEE